MRPVLTRTLVLLTLGAGLLTLSAIPAGTAQDASPASEIGRRLDRWKTGPDAELLFGRADASADFSDGEAGPAVALCLGLNTVGYGDKESVPPLDGCVADARAVAALLRGAGFAVTLRTNERATADVLKDFLARQAKSRVAGDTVVVYYAGHGSQVPDEDGDEESGMDDVYLLYDRLLIDDELFDLWDRFKTPGVRIVLITDSCTSGGAFYLISDGGPGGAVERIPKKVRRVLPAVAEKLPRPSRAINPRARGPRPPGPRVRAGGLSMEATAVHLAACPDEKSAAEVGGRGWFTTKLVEVWDGGRFDGGYPEFLAAVRQRIPDQDPQYNRFGPPLPAFEGQRPFSK